MIAIHQPQFCPWAPYFYKILQSDLFVFLDHVQFEKNGIQNRNKIKTPQGAQWVTIPVNVTLGDSINEVKVANSINYNKLLKTIDQNYKKSAFYDNIFPLIERILKNNQEKLFDICNELILKIINIIDIDTPIEYSSKINTIEEKDDLVIEIIKFFGAKEYLSGKGALNYMDLNKFKKERITVFTYDFDYLEYPQLWNKHQGFIPDLSFLDYLFNDLKNAKSYLNNCGKFKKIN